MSLGSCSERRAGRQLPIEREVTAICDGNATDTGVHPGCRLFQHAGRKELSHRVNRQFGPVALVVIAQRSEGALAGRIYLDKGRVALDRQSCPRRPQTPWIGACDGVVGRPRNFPAKFPANRPAGCRRIRGEALWRRRSENIGAENDSPIPGEFPVYRALTGNLAQSWRREGLVSFACTAIQSRAESRFRELPEVPPTLPSLAPDQRRDLRLSLPECAPTTA